eukprot:1532390-Prymnesium_polylepis.1
MMLFVVNRLIAYRSSKIFRIDRHANQRVYQSLYLIHAFRWVLGRAIAPSRSVLGKLACVDYKPVRLSEHEHHDIILQLGKVGATQRLGVKPQTNQWQAHPLLLPFARECGLIPHLLLAVSLPLLHFSTARSWAATTTDCSGLL